MRIQQLASLCMLASGLSCWCTCRQPAPSRPRLWAPQQEVVTCRTLASMSQSPPGTMLIHACVRPQLLVHVQAASAKQAAPMGASAGGGDVDDDLQARLNNLRKVMTLRCQLGVPDLLTKHLYLRVTIESPNG